MDAQSILTVMKGKELGESQNTCPKCKATLKGQDMNYCPKCGHELYQAGQDLNATDVLSPRADESTRHIDPPPYYNTNWNKSNIYTGKKGNGQKIDLT
jgi:tRNA(Ile2) C34 agmatinyltransferase TiaS